MSSDKLILLVNDIPDHLAAYETALARHGFRVQVARTGEQALEAARQSLPHCAVIDLRLPDMSGWDLCRDLKSRESPQTRVIVLTPDVSKMCAADSTKVGCHAWLAHPTVAEDLVRTVRQVLELDEDAPSSFDTALMGMTACPGCDSDQVRAQLRVGGVQYYCCKACGFCWRMEVFATHP
jgi:DNA-binding response OmpR family regulator